MPPSGFVVRLPCAIPGVFSGANIMFFFRWASKNAPQQPFFRHNHAICGEKHKSKEDGRKFPVILLNVMYVASLYYGFIV